MALVCENVLCRVKRPAVLLNHVSTVPPGGGNSVVQLQYHLCSVHTVNQGDATPAQKPPRSICGAGENTLF